jgi:2-dehydropantoate 2-reductase
VTVCVYGAGAVGGYLAARLISAGSATVSVVAAERHVRAIAQDGLRLVESDAETVVRPAATVSTASALPPQDIVFVTLKTPSYRAAAGDLARLVAPGGHVVFAGNGIPWWWNHGMGTRSGPLPLVDPDGLLWQTLSPTRVLGCVVYSINEVVGPGVVRHSGNNRWVIGEPDGSSSARLRRTVAFCREAGIMAEASADLRRDIWVKLLRNAPLNSICALTRLSMDRLHQPEGLAMLCDAVIGEIAAIALAHGWDIRAEISGAQEAPRRGGALTGEPATGKKPSMLQDSLAGRRMEVEAILGQPQLFAREAGVPTPVIDVLLPLLRGLELCVAARA